MGTNKLTILLALVGFMAFTGCATLPDITNKQASYTLKAPPQASLSTLVSENNSVIQERSGFTLLNEGVDAFIARMALARAAETSIDAQYYIWHDDLTGRLLLNELIAAAERGVRIRLLVDDINLSAAADEGLALLATFPTVSVRVFNPFSRNANKTAQLVTRFGRVTRRMHNKSFIADGQVTIIGGRNVGDEYFGANAALEFGDLDVLAIGRIVNEVSSAFDLYWNSEFAYPIESLNPSLFSIEFILERRAELESFVLSQRDSPYADKVKTSTLLRLLQMGQITFSAGKAELFYDQPEKIANDRDRTDLHLISGLAAHPMTVKNELLIVTPYFVPGDEGVEFFKSLIQRGVRVKILTNSLASTDVSIVHAGYKKHRKPLLKAGVELYEMKSANALKLDQSKTDFGSSRASLHAKTFVIDRHSLFIGSLNIDPRSITENTEVGMLIHSTEVSGILANWFDRELGSVAYELEWEEGVDEIRWHEQSGVNAASYDHDPNTSWWLRRWVDLMSLFPIDSQL